jgi:hypothetical protein
MLEFLLLRKCALIIDFLQNFQKEVEQFSEKNFNFILLYVQDCLFLAQHLHGKKLFNYLNVLVPYIIRYLFSCLLFIQMTQEHKKRKEEMCL